MRLALAGLLWVVAAPAAAAVYRWVDDQGVQHFTTNPNHVPRAYRAAMQRVQGDPTAIPEDVLPVPGGATPPFLERSSERPRRRARVLSSEEQADVDRLEALIHADRESIKSLISEGRWLGPELVNDPELRELAERLPRLQAELAAIRAGRPR